MQAWKVATVIAGTTVIMLLSCTYTEAEFASIVIPKWPALTQWGGFFI